MKKREPDPQQWLTRDALARIWAWRCGGADLKEVARRMGVSRKVLEGWRTSYPALAEATELSREGMDALVEMAFFRECTEKRNATLLSLWLRNRQPGDWTDKPVFEPPREETRERELSLEEKGELLRELVKLFPGG